VTFGISCQGWLLVVSHAEREENVRIISARLAKKGERKFMKKGKSRRSDDLRPEYKRSDFGEIARGKYARLVSRLTNVIVLDPKVAKAFPNDKAVNDTLRSLLDLAKTSSRQTARSANACPKQGAQLRLVR
jgi:hypothetical protein